MKTQVVSPECLDVAVSHLRQGEPIAFPTETVYGLGAPVFHEKALHQIFAIKQRPSDNPLIVHICSMESAIPLTQTLPKTFYMLAEKFWPGPLTLVVWRSEAVPDVVSAGHPTIALRMPAHRTARRLIEQLGEPIAAPSANLSGRPSPTSAQDVLEDLEGKIPVVVDAGPCAIGIESTVLSLVSPSPLLLRPGSIRVEELEEVLKEPILSTTSGTPNLSPGMKYRHYAPKGKVRLVFDPQKIQGGHLLSRVTQRNLYASLREADRLGATEIEVLCDAAVRQDSALMNRLLRAAGQVVI